MTDRPFGTFITIMIYRVRTLNKISPTGLNHFPGDTYIIGPDIENPHALLVRSHEVHSLNLPESLMCIARAGIGTDNIPIDRCTDRGIVVFNTPGANANSVKELVILGLLMASRKVERGITWCRSLAGGRDEIPALIEKGKSQFAGPEIYGKRLGVIGVGNVGSLVANDAIALGMKVSGFDPFISVESAWCLSREVRRVFTLKELLADSDYVTVNLPLSEETQGMINAQRFDEMNRGVRLLNFARKELVETEALIDALNKGIVSVYATDFPDAQLLEMEQVVPIPHLGASTPEAEENCAVAAVNQVAGFLETGEILNSVNFPDCSMPATTRNRILVANENVPGMVSQITSLLADVGMNIADMINRHREDLAYNIIDLDSEISNETLDQIRRIRGIKMVRLLSDT